MGKTVQFTKVRDTILRGSYEKSSVYQDLMILNDNL